MVHIKSLMLGDLVSVDDRICKVIELGGMACVAPLDDEMDELFCKDEDIEPIPLTAEILEKNRFFRDGESWWYKDFRIVLSTSKGESLVCGRQMRFEYVHELQHALRLCGIDKEIAL